MNKVNLKYGLIALAGMGISANVSALECSDVTFTPEAYAAYEFVDKACLEMVDRDGGTYAKMTATVVAQVGSRTHVRYRHSDGDLGPSHKANVPKNFVAHLAGQDIEIRDMAVRQEFNVYIGNSYWAESVVEVAAAAAPPPPPPPPPPAPEPEPEPEPEVLPTTASSLPLLALFGGLFLVLGSALRLSRKQ
jgi:hypothetical protein